MSTILWKGALWLPIVFRTYLLFQNSLGARYNWKCNFFTKIEEKSIQNCVWIGKFKLKCVSFPEVFLVVKPIKMQQYCMLSRIHVQMDKILFYFSLNFGSVPRQTVSSLWIPEKKMFYKKMMTFVSRNYIQAPWFIRQCQLWLTPYHATYIEYVGKVRSYIKLHYPIFAWQFYHYFSDYKYQLKVCLKMSWTQAKTLSSKNCVMYF